jgi:septum formation inhibitor MinC
MCASFVPARRYGARDDDSVRIACKNMAATQLSCVQAVREVEVARRPVLRGAREASDLLL